jgi:hypothetical protein
MTTLELIEHLRTEPARLRVRRSGAVLWSDEDRHTGAFTADPVGYALLALVPGTPAEPRARMLLCLLASWAGYDAATRDTLARVARVLTLGLPATLVVTVLLALRHRRANHKHVTRAAVRLLVEHPDAGRLAHTHRAVLVSIVEHALGKATARGCARALAGGDVDVDVRRALLRFAADPAVASERVRALYAPVPVEASAPEAVPPIDLDLEGERPETARRRRAHVPTILSPEGTVQ